MVEHLKIVSLLFVLEFEECFKGLHHFGSGLYMFESCRRNFRSFLSESYISSTSIETIGKHSINLFESKYHRSLQLSSKVRAARNFNGLILGSSPNSNVL